MITCYPIGTVRFGTRLLAVDAAHRRGILTHGKNNTQALVVGYHHPGSLPEKGDLFVLNTKPVAAYVCESVREVESDPDFKHLWLARAVKWLK